ncbi:MAG TPA: hypothetical protein DCE42_13510, partial [Myxococcales bacterium]|nr:hypothetical protein [Myxococcales bacterium]
MEHNHVQGYLSKLRELLAQPPTRKHFAQVLRLFRHWDEPKSREVGLLYARDHLEGWSDTIRFFDLSSCWPDYPEGPSQPPFSLVRTLSFDLATFSSEDIDQLVQSTYLQDITTLDLRARSRQHGTSKQNIEKIKRLFHAPSAPAPQALRLDNNLLGPDGTTVLMEAESLASLTTLSLAKNNIQDEGAIAIADSPYMTALTRLDLAANRIGVEGLVALSSSFFLTGLRALDLSRNTLGDAGL